MTNKNIIFRKYHAEFYGFKKNVELCNYKVFLLPVATTLFIGLLFLSLLHSMPYTAYLTNNIDNALNLYLKKQSITGTYFVALLTSEAIMLITIASIQYDMSKQIKNRLYTELNLKVKDEMNNFKQKWLCKQLKCFPHELATIATNTHNNNLILKSLKKAEPFSINALFDLIFNKDAKTRINGWLIAFISLIVGLFISKQKTFSINIVFNLLNASFFFSDLIISIGAICFVWMAKSIFIFVKDLIISDTDRSNIAISDMIKLSDYNKSELT